MSHTYIICTYTYVHIAGDGCPIVPHDPTNNTVEVAEHSDHIFNFTIKANIDTTFKWCFVKSDGNHSMCCYCNAESDRCYCNAESDRCQVPNWKITLYRHDCYQYTCSLTIHDVSMNYSDGTFISTARSPRITKDVNYTRILVTQNNKQKSIPLPVCYSVTGVGIISAIIALVMCMFMIKRGCCQSRSHYMHHGDYEIIPPNSPCKIYYYMTYKNT